MAMGQRLLRLLDLDRQHALLAIHEDTDNTHLHIAVHAREPDGRQIIINKGFTRLALEHANAVLCHENGLTPEAGLQFYANDEGVFRSDHHKIRDADFVLVSKDAGRITAGQTPKSRREEERTGYQSTLSYLQDVVPGILKISPNASHFLLELATEGIRYECVGSGARIGYGDEWFKASQISPRLSAKKIAARFRVHHYTAKQREIAGLYETPDAPYPLIVHRRDWKPERPCRKTPLPGDAAENARTAAALDDEETKHFPPFDPVHAKPLDDVVTRARKWLLSLDPGLDYERDVIAAKWIHDRLADVSRRMAGSTRGRPAKRRSPISDDAPQIAPNATDGCLIGSAPCTEPGRVRWDGEGRVEFKSGFRTIYRDDKPTVSFCEQVATFHGATDADLAHALRAATDRWGKVSVYGDSKFQRRMIRIAVREGVILGNVELATYQARVRERTVASISREVGAKAAALTSVVARLHTAVGRQLDLRQQERAGAAAGDRIQAAAHAMTTVARERAHLAASQIRSAVVAIHASSEASFDHLATRLNLQGSLISAALSDRDAARERAAEQSRLARQAEKEIAEAKALQSKLEQEAHARRLQNVRNAKADIQRLLVAVDRREAAVRASVETKPTNAVVSGPASIASVGKAETQTTPSASLHHKITLEHAAGFRNEAGAKNGHAPAGSKADNRVKAETVAKPAMPVARGDHANSEPKTARIVEQPTQASPTHTGDPNHGRPSQPDARTAEMYRLWDAYDQIADGKAIGSLNGSTLEVMAIADSNYGSFELDESERV